MLFFAPELRGFASLALGLTVVVALPLGSQTARFVTEATAHYEVLSDTGSRRAAQIGRRMESALELINSIYHFDLGTMSEPLRVRVYGTKTDYDRHLVDLVPDGTDDFVYIHFPSAAQSELVGYERLDGRFDRSLLHVAALQLAKAVIPEMPIWIREGVAAYVEAARYDEEQGEFVPARNVLWLPTLKDLLAGNSSARPLPMNVLGLLTDDQNPLPDVVYAQSWGVVDFLLAAPDQTINRIFWDTIAALRPAANLRENSSAALTAFSWIDAGALQVTFERHVAALHTYADLIELGTDSYSKGRLEQAFGQFSAAIELDTDPSVGHYYQGLIRYATGRYDDAPTHYGNALTRGAEPALILYALGVNAYAANRLEESARHLIDAGREDPTYRDRTNQLLNRIETQR